MVDQSDNIPPSNIVQKNSQVEGPAPQYDGKARITVVEHVYHQVTNEQPVAFESSFTRWLFSDEQPYTRKKTAKEEWESLDFGWVSSACALIIKNEGTRFSVQPSKQEIEEAAKKVLEMTYSGFASRNLCWLIAPGESMRAEPSSLRDLMIRCRHGEIKYTVTLIPK